MAKVSLCMLNLALGILNLFTAGPLGGRASVVPLLSKRML